MIIAMPYENEEIFQHFGKSQEFILYSIEDKTIISSEIRPTEGLGHGDLVGLLKSWNVSMLICSGLGAKAQRLLAEASIETLVGVTGKTTEQLNAYLNGTIVCSDAPYSCDCNHK